MNGTKDKTISCRISSKHYEILKKDNVKLSDIVDWYLRQRKSKELLECKIQQLKDKIIELKLDQIVFENQIKELEEEVKGVL